MYLLKEIFMLKRYYSLKVNMLVRFDTLTNTISAPYEVTNEGLSGLLYSADF